ncbi:hypothetical protein PM082_000859 [Marasmius tenuissimus]|nr:hypothetical protein PM082_000859 [Marasmius tenuissimus]
MGFLAYFSSSSPATVQTQASQSQPVLVVAVDDGDQQQTLPAQDADVSPSQPSPADLPPSQPKPPITEPSQPEVPQSPPSKPRARRFSLQGLNRNPAPQNIHKNEHKAILTEKAEHKKEAHAMAALSKRIALSRRSKSEKQAKESALIVRSLIVGPSASSPSVTTAIAKPRMSKLKSDLSKPKRANKVIAQLRSLPATDLAGQTLKEHPSPSTKCAPIHAVCLEHSDMEEHDLHFAQLSAAEDSDDQVNPIDKLSSMINEMRVVDFFKAPDLGLGQPGDGQGLLAGALPTAETVINGIEQITPQLMALGYATGRAIVPDHTGVYPPMDRISIITYWWGLEILLPPPSLEYLATARSISNTAVNFLSALSLVNGGVREIIPFVRYISQFIEFEFNSIKAQDKGEGVVCAATWIMPAALIPRPWDFPTPPPPPPTSTAIPEEPEPTETGDKEETKRPPAAPVGSPAGGSPPQEPPKASPGTPPAKVDPISSPTAPDTPFDLPTDDRAVPVMPITIPVN